MPYKGRPPDEAATLFIGENVGAGVSVTSRLLLRADVGVNTPSTGDATAAAAAATIPKVSQEFMARIF